LEQYEVWFITGSQHLYGPETLEQVEAHSRRIVDGLNATAGLAVRLVWKPTLTTREGVTRLMREASAAETCIGLVTWMHTFSPAKMWVTGLENLSKPFCQLHTQFNRDIPWDSIDMDFMNLNQTAHGGREFGFIGSRLRKNRKVIVGHWEDNTLRSRLDVWMRAAAAAADAGTLAIARFGDNMRDVAVTEGDKVEAEKVFGYSVSGYGLGDLADEVEAVADNDVDRLVEQYREAYIQDNSVSTSGEDSAARIRTAARMELGLRSFLERGGFNAFTTTFENLHGLDQLPGLACQRLMADGYGFGAEGDWKTAALVRAVKVMGLGLSGGTSFMEDYTYHFDPARPLVLGAHMLEICPSIADGSVRLETHPLGIGGKDDPPRLVFRSATGPAINVSVMDMGNRFRLVLNEVKSVAAPAELPSLPVARVVWEPQPDLATAAAAWIHAGGAHHTVYSQAVTREHIVDFATINDVELLSIGPGSTVEGIRNEIRWNEMYYHLARGL
jgi:L-arabinose isomerase